MTDSFFPQPVRARSLSKRQFRREPQLSSQGSPAASFNICSGTTSRADQYGRILAIPSKRAALRVISHSEPEEARALIAAIDPRAPHGARDRALLLSSTIPELGSVKPSLCTLSNSDWSGPSRSGFMARAAKNVFVRCGRKRLQTSARSLNPTPRSTCLSKCPPCSPDPRWCRLLAEQVPA